ncbi:MAG: transglycosylase SLT domain-containing protein [Desulfuromonadales bacterium]|nr:transglycosylase SLT domain-containing protein [Desulfuromonadales bacterium]
MASVKSDIPGRESNASFVQDCLLISTYENNTALAERLNQIPAIITVFARRTDIKRAKYLANLCFAKTLKTSFMPIDLAEIAIAETGGNRLSSGAVSRCGALGVWQLMPERAISHGFKPADMTNDEKCATAAIEELTLKLKMASGNISKAKRLYCGTGSEARVYESRVQGFRQEILQEMLKNQQIG